MLRVEEIKRISKVVISTFCDFGPNFLKSSRKALEHILPKTKMRQPKVTIIMIKNVNYCCLYKVCNPLVKHEKHTMLDIIDF